MKTKYVKKIILIVILLAVSVHSQSAVGQRNQNEQVNRNQNNKSNIARSNQNQNQNQNSRKHKDNKAPQRLQQKQRVKENENIKTQKMQIQKQLSQNQTKEYKNQKKLTNRDNQTTILTNLTEVKIDKQDTITLKTVYLQSEEEVHQRADSKRQSLIKLMFLIVLGLIVIIIILLLKSCIKRSNDEPVQTQNTENPIPSNQAPSFIFQTFGQNDNHVQRIIIKQKETKIEIIKDRFLNKQGEKGVNVVTMTVTQQEQLRVSTPTFAQGSAHKKM